MIVRSVLNDAGEADASVSSMQSAPTGMLSVSFATTLALCICPLCWVTQFPDVSVNLELDNRSIEMISEGYDAARCSLRVKSRKPQFVWSQALDIFKARGPRQIEDLGAHKFLHYTNQANGAVWKVTSQTGVKSVQWVALR